MKRFFKILGIVIGILLLLMVAAVIYINSAFPDADPPPDITVISNPELELRGEYLANHVAMCLDCHSTRDWTKYAGPVIPGTEGKGGDAFLEEMGFPGDIYSPNITPAAIKHWTDGELIRAITTGVDKEGEALFPIMPYLNYNKIADRDLHAIVSFIRTLKPIENEVPETRLNFPMNIIVKTIPPESYQPQPMPDMRDTVEYGKYLTTIASCGDCHTPTSSGEPIPGKTFAGGNEFVMPDGIIRSANLTPDNETGIGGWTKAMFINRFKSFQSDSLNNSFIVEANFNTIMPWRNYAGMTEEDLGAIYEYLRTLQPVKNQFTKFTPRAKK